MSFKLSESAGTALARLQRSLRLPERPPLLRLALAAGIRHAHGIVPSYHDSRGPEIPVKVLNGGRETLYDALIISTFPEVTTPLEAGERRRILKCLVDAGIDRLWSDYERLERSDYLAVLAREYLAS